MPYEELYQDFPQLLNSPHQVASPADDTYNCFAWAAGVSSERWEPAFPWYWPDGAPRSLTRAALEAAYQTAGYLACESADLETGYEKVALYAIGQRPTHAARQLPSGTWTSKLGFGEDIEHTLDALEGRIYGQVFQIMRRLR